MERILKGITKRETEIILKYDLLYTPSNHDQLICILSTKITPKKTPSSPKFNFCPKSFYPVVRAVNNPFSLFQGRVPKTNPNKEILMSPQLAWRFIFQKHKEM